MSSRLSSSGLIFPSRRLADDGEDERGRGLAHLGGGAAPHLEKMRRARGLALVGIQSLDEAASAQGARTMMASSATKAGIVLSRRSMIRLRDASVR